MSACYSVKYSHQKTTSSSKTGSSLSGHVTQKSEILVKEVLEKKHRNEIILINEIKWK